jgi:hypothetical protein
MDRIDDPFEMDFWVVHVDIKILSTVVWEGVVNGFKNKQEAEEWQKKFMEHAPYEASTALILTEIAPKQQELADRLREEINRFATGLALYEGILSEAQRERNYDG